MALKPAVDKGFTSHIASPNALLVEVCNEIAELQQQIAEEEHRKAKDTRRPFAERLEIRKAGWRADAHHMERLLKEEKQRCKDAKEAGRQEQGATAAVEAARNEWRTRHRSQEQELAAQWKTADNLEAKLSDLASRRDAQQEWTALEDADVAEMEVRLSELRAEVRSVASEAASTAAAAAGIISQDTAGSVRWHYMVSALLLRQESRDLELLQQELAIETQRNVAEAQRLQNFAADKVEKANAITEAVASQAAG
mmetsp:Transcript_58870/g.140434  ORF Transcript_58870/g.140434 Transcript_58870/m.140434 type:complete len:254 (+) Transcript_58870:83-844(+)